MVGGNSGPDLRDRLAVDRTILANVRTLLAFVRTALAFVVVGASAIKFFDNLLLEIAGWIFVGIGLALMALGVRRYHRSRERIVAATRKYFPDYSSDQDSA